MKAILRLRVLPNARRTTFAGRYAGDTWKVKVEAPPVRGKANQAVILFLSKKLGVPRNAVRLVSGENTRDKVFEVEGLDARSLAEKLADD